MKPRHEARNQKTVDTINGLLDSGIKKLSVIIRHSDRFFSKDDRMEPFMGLTQKGKSFAMDFGASLPATPVPRLFSSMIGRCIETAYLIDKGFTRQHKTPLDNILINDFLAPFYMKDIEKAIHMFNEQGDDLFIRNWLDNKIDNSVMENPETTAEKLSKYMTGLLRSINDNEIAICISHDWNIFPLKEFKLGLPHGTKGEVRYLEGVVFYEEEGKYFVTSCQSAPKSV